MGAPLVASSGALPVLLSSSEGVCRGCRRVVPARYVAEDDRVFLERHCPEHGPSRALVAESLAWYLDALRAPVAATPPAQVGPRTGGCPTSCGPCSFHAQACHLPVFSITNACDLRCPICFTYNRDDRMYFMDVAEFERHLDFVEAATGGVDLINVTGGEPTLHPQLTELLARAVRRPAFGRVTMNTNGLRLARDPALARALAELGVYVVLSLDTLDPQRSVALHGRDIVAEKRAALANLAAHGVSTTLLMVLVGGVNEDEVPTLLDLLEARDHVRSLTIQTMTYTGQGGGAFLPRQHVPVDRVERLVEEATAGRIARRHFQPLPTAHPLCYGVSYLLGDADGRLHPFAELLDRETIAAHLAGGYLLHPGPGLEAALRDAIDRLWSEGRQPGLRKALKDTLRAIYPSGETLSVHARQRRAERTVKTIYVHAHMDEDTWEVGRAMRCPDQVPVDAERLVGACNYNLFYRMKDARFWLEDAAGAPGGSAPEPPPRAPGPLLPRPAERPPEAMLAATRALCNECGQLVDAKVVEAGGRVLLAKWCPEHGETRALVSSDPAWYRRSLGYVKPGTDPLRRAVADFAGCPDSCGLCPSHAQHSCVPILEVTERCDLACPICLAHGRGEGTLTVAEVAAAMDRLAEYEGLVNMLTVSGGEPTMHPDLLRILDEVRRPNVGVVSLSTNGLRLAEDDALLREVVARGVVLSLQFDGVRPATYARLRGRADLADVKRRLVERVLALGGKLSLTFTLARGVNEDELGAALELLFREDQVLSLMVQPLAHTGRGRVGVPHDPLDVVTIPDAVRLLAASSGGVLREDDFSPLPCSHPTCFALTYLLKTDTALVPLPRIVDADSYLDVIKNQALFGTDRDTLLCVKDALYALWSSNGIVPDRDAVLRAVKRVLGDLNRAGSASHGELIAIGTRHVKSVFVHHFMDRYTFDLSRLQKCCNHYPQRDGRLVPACAQNNLPRGVAGE